MSETSNKINTDLIINKIAAKITARPSHIKAVLDLLADSGTVPFIARYRKELTGSMGEDDIRTVKDEYEKLYKTEERRFIVLQSLKSQDKFTDLDEKKQVALENKILNAKSLTEIEDLYLPYKPKRVSLATKALEMGLGPLADIIKEERVGTEQEREEILARFITGNKAEKKKKVDVVDDNIIKKPLTGQKLIDAQKKEKEEKIKQREKNKLLVKDEKEAIKGAIDILSEEFSQIAEFRKYIREICFEKAILVSKVNKKFSHLHKTQEQIEKELREEEAKKVAEELKKKAKLEEEELAKTKKSSKKSSKKTAKKSSGKMSASEIKELIRQQEKEQKLKKLARQKKLEAEKLRRQSREIGDLVKTEGTEGELGEKKSNPLVYEMYFDFRQEITTVPPHRVLAMNRGEKEGVLDVSVEFPDNDLVNYMKEQLIKKPESMFLQEYAKSIEYAYRRYIIRSIEREIRSELTKTAENHAIEIFAKNLGALLMQPPLKNRAILAVDPGFTHGSKIAVIDAKGNYKEDAIVLKYERRSLPPQEARRSAQVIVGLMHKYKAYTVAIGNGTASREAEDFIAKLASQIDRIEYVIVNEAGASVYSASKMAAEEFPDLTVEARGAISIARRLQDPLSELIKIDPKSIGVGLYQHDVNQRELKKRLDAVIEDSVNNVGVIVNSASYKLLEYVSGLNARLARNLYDRIRTKSIRSREELKKLPGIGEKTFEQCAGFLKIIDGDNPLDGTNIHPESYWIVEGILKFIDEDVEIIRDVSRRKELAEKVKSIRPKELIKFLQKDVGLPTLKDIVMTLLKPGRDPRDDLPAPILRKDVLKLEDLEEGMILKGTVRNVVDFGAFTDIGLHDDGLVHISQMKRLDGKSTFIENPTDVLSVGDIIDVRVISVDKKKGRIQLSMKLDPAEDVKQKSEEDIRSFPERGGSEASVMDKLRKGKRIQL